MFTYFLPPNSPIATPLFKSGYVNHDKTKPRAITHINSRTNTPQGPERHNLSEEIEQVVSSGSVREERDRGVSWPRDDRDQENAHEERAVDTVQHQEDSEEPVWDVRNDVYARGRLNMTYPPRVIPSHVVGSRRTRLSQKFGRSGIISGWVSSAFKPLEKNNCLDNLRVCNHQVRRMWPCLHL